MELPTVEQVYDANPSAQAAKTYWLLGARSQQAEGCKKLVDNYDFVKADLFRTANELPLGSLLAVRFPDNRTFYVNLTEASKKQHREVLLSWYKVASTTDEAGTTVKSNSIAARMKLAICEDGSGIVGSFVGLAAGALGPFGFVVEKGRTELCNITVV